MLLVPPFILYWGEYSGGGFLSAMSELPIVRMVSAPFNTQSVSGKFFMAALGLVAGLLLNEFMGLPVEAAVMKLKMLAYDAYPPLRQWI